jgi:hypothetical protein
MILTTKELEDVFRIECTKRGLRAGLCLPPMTGEQVQKYAIPHSLSRAWFLGKYEIYFFFIQNLNICEKVKPNSIIIMMLFKL